MSGLAEQTNEADVTAVTEVVRAYYDGTMTGDQAKLASAFHPLACIVGTWDGKLDWVTRDEYIAECKKAPAKPGNTTGGSMEFHSRGTPPSSGSAPSTPASTTATTSP